ncbi:MAG: hypothetical protein ABI622_00525 [Chloroflexota bacterium]
MTTRTRCGRTAAIIERLLDGEPLGAAERAHLDGCPVCTRRSARATALDARITRAALAVAGEARIPAGVLDPRVVEPPVVERAGHGLLRLASLAAAAAVAVTITAVGLGMLRAPVAPTPGSPDMTAAGIAAQLSEMGLTCEEKPLGWYSAPPMTAHVCGAPKLRNVERYASTYTDGSGVTWLELKATVTDRHDDALVEPATAFLLDGVGIVFSDPVELTTVRGQLAGFLSDRLTYHDNRLFVGGRLVELEGSWSQGFVVRIGPTDLAA